MRLIHGFPLQKLAHHLFIYTPLRNAHNYIPTTVLVCKWLLAQLPQAEVVLKHQLQTIVCSCMFYRNESLETQDRK